MHLLDAFRVFSPDFIYTMPYVSWVRLLVLAFLLALIYCNRRALPVWSRATHTLSTSLKASWIDQKTLQTFAGTRSAMAFYGAMIIGAIVETTILLRPKSASTLLDNGFVSFAALDAAGWTLIVCGGCLAWLMLSMWLPIVTALGFVAGTIDATLYCLDLLLCFVFGMVMGPAALLVVLTMLRRNLGDNLLFLLEFVRLPITSSLNLVRRVRNKPIKQKRTVASRFSIAAAIKSVDGRE